MGNQTNNLLLDNKKATSDVSRAINRSLADGYLKNFDNKFLNKYKANLKNKINLINLFFYL
jgi:hypothetical protein